MARREITQYFDDLDETPLNEDEVDIINFSLDGTDYILDLSHKNGAKFREALAPFLAAAREAPVDLMATVTASEIRRWAKENNFAVAHRGKIPNEVIEAFEKAHVTD